MEMTSKSIPSSAYRNTVRRYQIVTPGSIGPKHWFRNGFGGVCGYGEFNPSILLWWLEAFGTCLIGRTGGEIFGLVDKVLDTNGLLWSNYVAIGSDDVRTLSGRKKGFKVGVKGPAAHVISRYCLMCRKNCSQISKWHWERQSVWWILERH
jgi:hypothetical protein